MRIDNDSMFLGDTNVEFRRIPHHPNYFISKNGDIRNVDGRLIRRQLTSSNSQVTLRVGARDMKIYRFKLIHAVWPEIAPKYSKIGFHWEGKEWRYLQNWPGYAISSNGTVIRLKNWTIGKTISGQIYMSKGGKQYSRSVRNLVLEEFGSIS